MRLTKKQLTTKQACLTRLKVEQNNDHAQERNKAPTEP